MIIKHYIVTYKNEKLLHDGLTALDKVNIPDGVEYHLNIINNHGELCIHEDYSNLDIHIINNELRSNHSTGHLSRNWNQGLILGFENLNGPKADIVVLSQADAKMLPSFLDTLIKEHEKYNFITQGRGDEFHSYTVDAIKNIGLWDERFCGIGYQEIDYFYRNKIFNNEFGSENNDQYMIDISVRTGYEREDDSHIKSLKYHAYNLKLLCIKYGLCCDEINPTVNCYDIVKELNSAAHDIKIDSYFYYPYFEKNINQESLIKQKYNIQYIGD